MKMVLPPVLIVALALLLGGRQAVVAEEKQAGDERPPLPADFPQLTRDTSTYFLAHGTLEKSATANLYGANSELLWSLSKYSPASVSAVFGERMKKETDVHMQLLLAEVAAGCGNSDARKLIEDSAATTDPSVTQSRLDVLSGLLEMEKHPAWVVDAVLAALGDQRTLSIAERYPRIFYRLRGPEDSKLVPLLIKLARRPNSGPEPLEALANIGDPRAIPVCLEYLRREVRAIETHKSGNSAPTPPVLYALVGLKVRAAVPVLLKYLPEERVIEALGKMGDPRAIEPLKRIAAQGPPAPKAEGSDDWSTDPSSTARLALIRFEADPVNKWIEIAQDQSFPPSLRIEAIAELGSRSDPRAIAPLLAVVESDPYGSIVAMCVQALASFRYKVAVEGLIECFDVDYAAKPHWVPIVAASKGMPRRVAWSLKAITGEDFGPDKAKWKQWWDDKGHALESLK